MMMSRQWPGNFTPSSRRSYGENIASMAWGARNLISTQASHPAFAAHPIQGWTPDFIPKVLEDAPMAELQDELFPIPGDAAVNTAKALAAKEGLLTGISGGGTMYAALETAKKAPKGSVILAMLPDTGERYLSTPLFADIEADMNEAELEIAKSTPGFQLLPQ